jgi:hypothetical protein
MSDDHMPVASIDQIDTRKSCVDLGASVRIDLLEDDGEFLGLGAVTCGGISLRNPSRPMFVYIRNPWGVQLCNFRIARREEHADETRLIFKMDAFEGGPMDWQLHECRPVRNVSDWTTGAMPARNAELTLELRAVSRRIGDHEFQGFSYQYFYRSSEIPIYMLLDRGTWELKGSARASELWLRQSCAPPIYRPRSPDEHYSTEWYLPGCTNSNIFQFLPLQTQLQGFTMTAGDAGILLTWSPKVHHLRTLIEKPRGSDVFVHLHEHCGDLSNIFESAPMEVLFSPGATNRVERANVHGDMLELVYATLHADIGLRREYVPTYGQIEEWEEADLELYRRQGLPALAAAGIKHVELANQFQNNMNTWGLSNMCCNVDFKVAETVGEDKLRAFCADAAKRCIRVGMWGNTAIAVNTVQFARRQGRPKRIDHLPFEGSIMEALSKAKRPFVINSYGAIEADHYTTSFCVLNLRDPVVRDYWLTAWGRLNSEIGITGVFLDSSFNLSSDKFDWRFNADPDASGSATIDQTHLLDAMRPARTPPSSIETQYYAHLDLVRAMQHQGYVYCNEDCGVFGLHRSGPGVATRLNNLSMWREFITLFDVAAIRKANADPDDVFFKGLAYRMMWSLLWNVQRRELNFTWNEDSDDNRPSEWHLALYKAYNAVEKHMKFRKILSDETGVLYSDGPKQVLWSFAPLRLPLGSVAVVREPLSGLEFQTEVLEAKKHRIYLIASLQ